MDEPVKVITSFARRVKKARQLEQKLYNALSRAKPINTHDLANEHEIAMIATSVAERDLSSLVIRLLVDKKK